jgi:aminoglycoside 6-adenylyltransferase
VAKGLWQKEILCAKEYLHNNVRTMLLKMLEWQVGVETNFSVSTGKFNKYLEQYLSEESWHELLLTYAHGNYESTWEALFAACDLFRNTGKAVSKHFGYEYPYEDDERVTAYLKHTRGLSPSATEIFSD